MPATAKPQTKQQVAAPARKPAGRSTAQRASSRPAGKADLSKPAAKRPTSRSVTMADFDEFKAQILATIEHALWPASLPTEPCDEETAKLIRESLAETGPDISHEELRRELGL